MADYPRHLGPELLDCIESVVNETATAAQMRMLEEELANSAAARSIYLDYIDLHVTLQRRLLRPTDTEPLEFFTQLAESSNASERGQHRGGWGVGSWAVASLAMAATLLAVFTTSYLLDGNSDLALQELSPTQAVGEDQRASLTGVAVLSHAIDVRWSEGSSRPSVGSPLPLGNLSIDSGVIQLEFYCGAVAVLEGPASFDLLAADQGQLIRGKLRARVPSQAKGFTVVTPAGDVVDLGTEFAIDISKDDPFSGETTELHVLDGEVRFHATDDNGETPRHILGGQGLRLSSAANLAAEIAAVGDRFVGPTQLEAYTRQKASKRYLAWQEHRQQMLKDPALIACYAHSPEPQWSRTLRNFKIDAKDDTHGAIVGCDWANGRWPGHRALRFRNASHRVSINLPGVFDSLTLSTWISVNKLHPTNNVALMHPEIEQPRFLHWTLDRVEQSDAALLHFSESVGPHSLVQRNHYNSVAHALTERDVDRWVHLAVVYDSGKMQVSHFRNGQRINFNQIAEARKLSIGVANLGNWPYKDWAKGTEFETRNLNGRMDEYLAFGRALSEAEIAHLYRIGKP